MPKPEVPSASAANNADQVLIYQNGVRKLGTIGQIGPRIEEYTGTTNGGGNATVVFSESFASPPVAFSVGVVDGSDLVFSATSNVSSVNVGVRTTNGNEPYRIIVIGN